MSIAKLLVLLGVVFSTEAVDTTSKVTEQNFDEYFTEALKITKEAGKIIKDKIWQIKSVETKSNIDFVTETDREVENMIKANISSRFHDHKFMGEESTAEGAKLELSDNPTWIIDPLDGTTNFIHGYPHVSVSVALLVNKRTELGVVYNPVTDQLFTARRGKGAYLNGNPMRVSERKELTQALLTLAQVRGRSPEATRAMDESVNAMANLAQGVRGLGSASLDMAHVAMGGIDGFWHIQVRAWDVAAGDLLVREAGGVVLDPLGGSFDLTRRGVLCASTLELATQMSSKVQSTKGLFTL